VAGVETKPSDLERALRELRASRPEAELHLRGDDQLKYQTVVEVIKLAEKLGFPGVGYDPLVKR
jgi:biopolymer transport protein ExbD